MPKSSRAAGRSFFSNLPLELRTTLRSQTLVPLVPGANINDFKLDPKPNPNGMSQEGRDYLPTQPESPGSTVDDSISIQGIRQSHSEEPRDGGSTLVTMGESSTAGQKRAQQDPSMVSSSAFKGTGSQKRRKAVKGANGDVNGIRAGDVKAKSKGKGRAVDVGKRYKGHAWDCTGVVPRYTDPSELPSNLVKCGSFPLHSPPELLQSPSCIGARTDPRCRLVSTTFPLTPIRYPPATT